MNLQDIKNDRQFRSVTGLSKKEFEQLLPYYISTYENIFGEWRENKNTVEEKASKLRSLPGTLFFILFQLKNDLVYDSLGAIFKMDGSNAHRNYTKYMAILKGTLKRCNTYPKRYFESYKEFNGIVSEEEIIIDGEEQETERPQDPEYQEQKYSGKKKAYPEKYGNNE